MSMYTLNLQTVFLFTDGHVAQEGTLEPDLVLVCINLSPSCVGFLESINNMLTSGMVPALFPDDEKEAVIGQVR